jgi:SAM-dependent methyltransferase
MSNVEFVGSLLAPYEPRLPIDRLVVEVNKIYHAFEARDYDNRHPEIYKQLPRRWQAMVQHAMALRSPSAWRVMDFGCGSGFAAEQLLKHLPRNSVEQLVCYDPAPEMLELCRLKIRPLYPQAIFCSDLDALPADVAPSNLLATNSLLHHLPDPMPTINGLLPRLTDDALWLSGHEPSNRFFRNAECMRAYERFCREHGWRLYFSVKAFLGIVKQAVTFRRIAKETVRRGLFGKVPPPQHIDRLVDFYVAHTSEEARSGRGFNVDMMQKEIEETWRLTWVESYSFMGPIYEQRLTKRWLQVSRELQRKYPRDGANFCAVWSRTAASDAPINRHVARRYHVPATPAA